MSSYCRIRFRLLPGLMLTIFAGHGPDFDRPRAQLLLLVGILRSGGDTRLLWL